MVAYAENCRPDECCGLLAGHSGGVVRFVYPLTNSNASPVSYTIDAREHFAAWRHAERNGWELIGAFHSHPNGPSEPSATDRALAGEPDWAYVIVSGGSLYAYRMVEQAVTPIDLLVVDQLATPTGEQEAS
jgi:proteasome lid subunit RPN8/RPN11